MRNALSHTTFRGVIAYWKDHRVDNLAVFHSRANGVERERLVTLNGPLREVIRDGKAMRCYATDSKTVRIESKPPGQSAFVRLPEDFNRLRAYYRFAVGARDRVAQRAAQEITVTPRDDLRYARRIWIDADNKLPLKLELLDEQNQVVEQMVFASLDLVDSIPPEDLAPSYTEDQSIAQENQHENLPIDSLRWTMQNVPAGFQIASFARIRQAPQGRSIQHLLLSDGLSSVSIYFDQVEDRRVVAQPKKMGAINTYSRKVGDFVVTVMGEVPAKTVQLIGNGLRQQEEP